MNKYGYVKASSKKEAKKQEKEIAQYQPKEIFIDLENDDEKITDFSQIHEKLSENDLIIITNLEIFEKTLKEMLPFVQYLEKNNINVLITENGIDTRQKEYANFFKIWQDLLMVQTNVVSTLTKKSLEKSREEGAVFGRPRIDDDVIEKIRFLRKKKKLPFREIAERCDVSLGTVYKYVNEERK